MDVEIPSPKVRQQKSRSFAMTMFYDNEEEADDFISKMKSDNLVRYGIIGKEICPDTGRSH